MERTSEELQAGREMKDYALVVDRTDGLLGTLPPFSSPLAPCLPAGAVVLFILGLVECAHPMAFVAFASLSLIPSGCHFGSFQIFDQYFGSMLVQRRRSRRSLGILLCVSLHITIRALACCWHLRMRCTGVCGGAPLQLHPLSSTSLVGILLR